MERFPKITITSEELQTIASHINVNAGYFDNGNWHWCGRLMDHVARALEKIGIVVSDEKTQTD